MAIGKPWLASVGASEVSEENISLELLGARVATSTAEVRGLQVRFGALEQRFSAMETRLGGIEARLGGLEARFGAMEQRFGAQEERMTRMPAFLIRIAERIDGGNPG
jgi:hypothetical protein